MKSGTAFDLNKHDEPTRSGSFAKCYLEVPFLFAISRQCAQFFFVNRVKPPVTLMQTYVLNHTALL